MGSRTIALIVLIIGTRLHFFATRDRSRRYTLKRTMGESKRRSGRFGEQENFCPLLGIESWMAQSESSFLYRLRYPGSTKLHKPHTNTSRQTGSWKQRKTTNFLQEFDLECNGRLQYILCCVPYRLLGRTV